MGKRLEKHGICLETSYASIHTCQLPIIASSGGQGDISLFTGSILYLAGSRCRGVGQLYLLDPQCATRRKPECHVLYYRTKVNAPKGSVYITLVSQDPVNIKKKLSYRVYLGGSSSHDFNLYDNTNYVYGIKMSHSELPVDGKRITIVNPIGASENNNNLVPTANCFMIVPGGAFLFRSL